ncbi:MAG: TetR/AcrR family transcriptional regulator [Streptomycetaceae bacterium]|nr:TetR/AcrR family transcriptional regulator [Streptomycetaceae bacterium]
MTGAKLTKEAIVEAAIALADAEGIDALSMRRIADRLGAGAMSLYRHVPNKDMLLAAMTDEVARRNPYPDPQGRDWTWRDRVRIAGEVDWDLYRRHPWVLFTFATPRYSFGPHSMAALAWMVDGFRQHTDSAREATRMSLAVWCCISGMALPYVSETMLARKGHDAAGHSALEALLRGEIDTPRPELEELAGSGVGDLVDQEHLLHVALTALCDGFEAQLRSQPAG